MQADDFAPSVRARADHAGEEQTQGANVECRRVAGRDVEVPKGLERCRC